MDINNILAFLSCIIFLFIFGKIFIVPLKNIFKLILNSIFGGIQCDLRQATISDKSVIEANSIFGGITIIVPEDVEVKVVATPIFGGVEIRS